MSMFTVINLVFPAETTLDHIYTYILSGHLQIFPEEVQIAPILIKMTLGLYKIMILELPPTPSKFHYIFNMRDLSRITAGMCKADPKFFTQQHHIVRMWRNEFTRVMCDRLINVDDQTLMRNHLVKQLAKYFPPKTVVTPEDDVDIVEYAMRDPLLFGDYR